MNFGGGHTAEARHRTFESELSAAVGGRPLNMHVGLGPDTDSALIDIALAHPDVTGDMIATARRAFATESITTESIATEAIATESATTDNAAEVAQLPEQQTALPGTAL